MPDRIDALREAAAARHAATLSRAETALAALAQGHEPVTFRRLAEAARVSLALSSARAPSGGRRSSWVGAFAGTVTRAAKAGHPRFSPPADPCLPGGDRPSAG